VSVEFRSAASVEEAVAWLAELGEGARVLAGGTDLMIQHMRREVDVTAFVHVGRIPGLAGVSTDGPTVIGALTTHRALASHPVILERHPALAEACATVGGWQTQEVGTLGGNLCNASPAADTAPPLLVAGAAVTLSGPAGERSVALDDFFLGRRHTARRPNEVLTAVTVPEPAPRTGEAYVKVGRRSAMEVAVVGVAVSLTVGAEGMVERARVAASAVAPRPFRCSEAEMVLQGCLLDDENIAEAGRVLADEATPIDDPRASASYRLRVLPAALRRAVRSAAARAEGR
jgi:carbon-monoxide dehydrogenase medium subunit